MTAPSVYIIHDERSQCLYVGQALSVPKRLEDHIYTPWWPKRPQVTVIAAPDKRTALDLENRLQEALRPLYASTPQDRAEWHHAADHKRRATAIAHRDGRDCGRKVCSKCGRPNPATAEWWERQKREFPRDPAVAPEGAS